MNKRKAIFVVLLFLYLFSTFDPISLVEKGSSLISMEQEKTYENPHKPQKTHERQNEPSNKLKNLKNYVKIRKKNKILEDKNNI